MSETRRPWLPRTKLSVSLLMLGLFVYLLTRFSVAIPPFILAVILAYILTPVVNIIEEQVQLPRGLITFFVFLLFIAILALVPIVFLPPFAEQFDNLNVDLQQFLSEAERLLGHRYVIAGQSIDGEAVFNQAVNLIQDLVQPLFGHTLEFAVEVISSLVWVVFIFVVSFYFVKDSRKVNAWIDQLPPPGYEEDFRRLRRQISQIWSSFFRGQLTLGLVVAFLFTVIGFAIGLPFALTMGVLAGLLEFLPSLGHGIWLTIATALALFGGSTWINLPNWGFALIVVGLHLLFQQFDLNYLIPKIIGRRVHLPPLVVILGIVAGAAMAGVLGIVLAAPTISSARVLFRYIFANLSDSDPFPEEVSEPLPPPDPRWWDFRQKSTDNQEEAKE